MVFTEFIEMVETTFSSQTVDELMEECATDLASGGAYTAVGYYKHDEMLFLVARLSKMKNIPEPELVHLYGKHLFGRFHSRYPTFFEKIDGAFAFLESVHDHIHVEVRKLYGDAKPPSLRCRRSGATRLFVDYQSDRPFAHLAHGLIDGCILHYGDPIAVTTLSMEPGGRSASFVLDHLGTEAAMSSDPEAARKATIA